MRKFDEIKSAVETLDQLVWLLRGARINEIENLISFFKKNLESNPVNDLECVNLLANKDYLVGSLPALFQDLKLFPRNEDIVDFAKDVLNIDVIHGYKKSRHEIIGRVICETLTLDESNLTKLVDALKVIKLDDKKIEKMKEKRNSGSLSWNQEIQELLKGLK